MRDPNLWAKISSFSFATHSPKLGRWAPKPKPGVTRLQYGLGETENWADDYILRAIEEYRRFIYLSRVTEGQITPSEVVDKVWHAHMADSEEYIERFCKPLFGEVLHHEPCAGPEEMPRYERQFLDTRTFYVEEFDAQPPVDIWDFRTGDERARDEVQAKKARWAGRIAGIVTAIVLFAVFANLGKPGWAVFGLFVGAVTSMIVHGVKTPKVPGPQYRSSDSSGAGGCSGCGD